MTIVNLENQTHALNLLKDAFYITLEMEPAINAKMDIYMINLHLHVFTHRI
jgi:hypothetical protein